MAQVYGDKERRRVAVISLMREYIQLPQELVRAYANHVKAKWRQAGWNLLIHEEVLYDIAWAGLRNSLKNNVAPMTPACSRFDTLEQFINKAAASEVTHVENKKQQRQQQQQQQQQQQKEPTDSSSKGGKRGYQPSISEPADTSGGGNSGRSVSNKHCKSHCGGQSSGFPPAPLVSTEIFKGRRSTGKC